MYYSELDSTNSFAKQLDKAKNWHGTLVLADHQSKGRGQYERVWHTQHSKNLTFSLVFEPKNTDRLLVLALACSLAVAEVSEDATGELFSIKWPNDILHENAKLSGLLTETQFNGNLLSRLVIGIGWNINQDKFDGELESVATSLAIIAGKEYPRELLLQRLLTKIEFYYRLWEQQEIELIKKINKKMIGYGEWAQLTVDSKPLDGEFKFLGVNERGNLMVLNKDLEVNTFLYEQIRVRFLHLSR